MLYSFKRNEKGTHSRTDVERNKTKEKKTKKSKREQNKDRQGKQENEGKRNKKTTKEQEKKGLKGRKQTLEMCETNENDWVCRLTNSVPFDAFKAPPGLGHQEKTPWHHCGLDGPRISTKFYWSINVHNIAHFAQPI